MFVVISSDMVTLPSLSVQDSVTLIPATGWSLILVIHLKIHETNATFDELNLKEKL